MTTIACDLNGMAADSKCVFGETFFPCEKIIRLPDGSLLATAGTDVYTKPFINKMMLGEIPDIIAPPETSDKPDPDFAAIHLTKDGVFIYDDAYSATKVTSGKFAIGTGGIVAISWLLNGATPQRAVEMACQVDNNSGLPVHYEPLVRANDTTRNRSKNSRS